MNPFLTSELGDDPVVSEAYLYASPPRVFRSWTDPEEVKSWFGHKPFSVQMAHIELRVGGRWLFAFDTSEGSYNAVGGEYLVIDENAQLTFTWRHERADDSGQILYSPVSEVDVDFAAHGSGTKLTVTHRNLATEEARRNVTGGWTPAISSLIDALENGDRSGPAK